MFSTCKYMYMVNDIQKPYKIHLIQYKLQSMNNRSRAESESVLSAGEYRRRYSPFTFTPRISSQGCALANWQCHRKYLRYHLWLWFWL